MKKSSDKRKLLKAKRKTASKLRKARGIAKKEKRAFWRRKKLNRLNVFRKNSTKSRIEYQFYSKSKSFNAIFSNIQFNHVNFKGATFTKCSFKNASFVGVEFWGTNLRKSNFTGAKFQHCVFVGTLLGGTNFANTTFENCIFVNINFDDVKNFNNDANGIRLLSVYPLFELSTDLEETINSLRDNVHILKYKILHLNCKKLNKLNIMLLLEKYKEPLLIQGLIYAKKHVKVDMPTISCLFNFLLKNKSQYVNI